MFHFLFLLGIRTIKSSGKEKLLCREFESHADNHTKAFFGYLVTHRWFSLRLDLLCCLHAISVLFIFIFFKSKHSNLNNFIKKYF